MCIVRLHVDNTIAEKQRMSPQTYPAMGLGVGGGAARFPSSPGPTPPGGLLPTGALNRSGLHLERRDTSGTLDCPGSLQNVHICSATSGVHSQAPCGQYYCRETVNVSTNLGGEATRLLSSPGHTPQEGFFPQRVTIQHTCACFRPHTLRENCTYVLLFGEELLASPPLVGGEVPWL